METLECIHTFLSVGIFLLFTLVCVLVNKCSFLKGGGDETSCICGQFEFTGDITPSNSFIHKEPGKPPNKLSLYKFLQANAGELSASCQKCCIGTETSHTTEHRELDDAELTEGRRFLKPDEKTAESSEELLETTELAVRPAGSEESDLSDIIEHTVRVKVKLTNSEESECCGSALQSTRVHETPSGTRIKIKGPIFTQECDKNSQSLELTNRQKKRDSSPDNSANYSTKLRPSIDSTSTASGSDSTSGGSEERKPTINSISSERSSKQTYPRGRGSISSHDKAARPGSLRSYDDDDGSCDTTCPARKLRVSIDSTGSVLCPKETDNKKNDAIVSYKIIKVCEDPCTRKKSPSPEHSKTTCRPRLLTDEDKYKITGRRKSSTEYVKDSKLPDKYRRECDSTCTKKNDEIAKKSRNGCAPICTGIRSHKFSNKSDDSSSGEEDEKSEKPRKSSTRSSDGKGSNKSSNKSDDTSSGEEDEKSEKPRKSSARSSDGTGSNESSNTSGDTNPEEEDEKSEKPRKSSARSSDGTGSNESSNTSGDTNPEEEDEKSKKRRKSSTRSSDGIGSNESSSKSGDTNPEEEDEKSEKPRKSSARSSSGIRSNKSSNKSDDISPGKGCASTCAGIESNKFPTRPKSSNDRYDKNGRNGHPYCRSARSSESKVPDCCISGTYDIGSEKRSGIIIPIIIHAEPKRSSYDGKKFASHQTQKSSTRISPSRLTLPTKEDVDRYNSCCGQSDNTVLMYDKNTGKYKVFDRDNAIFTSEDPDSCADIYECLTMSDDPGTFYPSDDEINTSCGTSRKRARRPLSAGAKDGPLYRRNRLSADGVKTRDIISCKNIKRSHDSNNLEAYDSCEETCPGPSPSKSKKNIDKQSQERCGAVRKRLSFNCDDECCRKIEPRHRILDEDGPSPSKKPIHSAPEIECDKGCKSSYDRIYKIEVTSPHRIRTVQDDQTYVDDGKTIKYPPFAEDGPSERAEKIRRGGSSNSRTSASHRQDGVGRPAGQREANDAKAAPGITSTHGAQISIYVRNKDGSIFRLYKKYDLHNCDGHTSEISFSSDTKALANIGYGQSLPPEDVSRTDTYPKTTDDDIRLLYKKYGTPSVNNPVYTAELNQLNKFTKTDDNNTPELRHEASPFNNESGPSHQISIKARWKLYIEGCDDTCTRGTSPFSSNEIIKGRNEDSIADSKSSSIIDYIPVKETYSSDELTTSEILQSDSTYSSSYENIVKSLIIHIRGCEGTCDAKERIIDFGAENTDDPVADTRKINQPEPYDRNPSSNIVPCENCSHAVVPVTPNIKAGTTRKKTPEPPDKKDSSKAGSNVGVVSDPFDKTTDKKLPEADDKKYPQVDSHAEVVPFSSNKIVPVPTDNKLLEIYDKKYPDVDSHAGDVHIPNNNVDTPQPEPIIVISPPDVGSRVRFVSTPPENMSDTCVEIPIESSSNILLSAQSKPSDFDHTPSGKKIDNNIAKVGSEAVKLYPQGEEESSPGLISRDDSTSRPYYTPIGSYISALDSSVEDFTKETYTYQGNIPTDSNKDRPYSTAAKPISDLVPAPAPYCNRSLLDSPTIKDKQNIQPYSEELKTTSEDANLHSEESASLVQVPDIDLNNWYPPISSDASSDSDRNTQPRALKKKSTLSDDAADSGHKKQHESTDEEGTIKILPQDSPIDHGKPVGKYDKYKTRYPSKKKSALPDDAADSGHKKQHESTEEEGTIKILPQDSPIDRGKHVEKYDKYKTRYPSKKKSAFSDDSADSGSNNSQKYPRSADDTIHKEPKVYFKDPSPGHQQQHSSEEEDTFKILPQDAQIDHEKPVRKYDKYKTRYPSKKKSAISDDSSDSSPSNSPDRHKHPRPEDDTKNKEQKVCSKNSCPAHKKQHDKNTEENSTIKILPQESQIDQKKPVRKYDKYKTSHPSKKKYALSDDSADSDSSNSHNKQKHPRHADGTKNKVSPTIKDPNPYKLNIKPYSEEHISLENTSEDANLHSEESASLVQVPDIDLKNWNPPISSNTSADSNLYTLPRELKKKSALSDDAAYSGLKKQHDDSTEEESHEKPVRKFDKYKTRYPSKKTTALSDDSTDSDTSNSHNPRDVNGIKNKEPKLCYNDLCPGYNSTEEKGIITMLPQDSQIDPKPVRKYDKYKTRHPSKKKSALSEEKVVAVHQPQWTGTITEDKVYGRRKRPASEEPTYSKRPRLQDTPSDKEISRKNKDKSVQTHSEEASRSKRPRSEDSTEKDANANRKKGVSPKKKMKVNKSTSKKSIPSDDVSDTDPSEKQPPCCVCAYPDDNPYRLKNEPLYSDVADKKIHKQLSPQSNSSGEISDFDLSSKLPRSEDSTEKDANPNKKKGMSPKKKIKVTKSIPSDDVSDTDPSEKQPPCCECLYPEDHPYRSKNKPFYSDAADKKIYKQLSPQSNSSDEISDFDLSSKLPSSEDSTGKGADPNRKKDMSPKKETKVTGTHFVESIPLVEVTDTDRSEKQPPCLVCVYPEDHPYRFKNKPFYSDATDKTVRKPVSYESSSSDEISDFDLSRYPVCISPDNKRRHVSNKKLCVLFSDVSVSADEVPKKKPKLYPQNDESQPSTSAEDDISSRSYKRSSPYVPSSSYENLETFPCAECKYKYEERSNYTSESKRCEGLLCYQDGRPSPRHLDADQILEKEKQNDTRDSSLSGLSDKVNLSCARALAERMNEEESTFKDYIKCVCDQAIALNQTDYEKWKYCYKEKFQMPHPKPESAGNNLKHTVNTTRGFRVRSRSSSPDDPFQTYKVSSKITITSRGEPIIESIPEKKLKPILKIRTNNCAPFETCIYKVPSREKSSIDNLTDNEKIPGTTLHDPINKEENLTQSYKDPVETKSTCTQYSQTQIISEPTQTEESESTATFCAEDIPLEMPGESVIEYLEKLRKENIIPYPPNEINETESPSVPTSMYSQSDPTTSTYESEYPSSRFSEAIAKYQKSLEEYNLNRRMFYRMEALRQSQLTSRNVINNFSDSSGTSRRPDFGQFYPYKAQPSIRLYPCNQPNSHPVLSTTSYPCNRPYNVVCPSERPYCYPISPDYNAFRRTFKPADNYFNHPTMESNYDRDKCSQQFRRLSLQKQYCDPKDIPSTSRAPDPIPQNYEYCDESRRPNCRVRYQFEK